MRPITLSREPTIPAIQRPYRPETDFLAVRDMLVRTNDPALPPINWNYVRWEYNRCFVAPMLGADLTLDSLENSIAGIRAWEQRITVWQQAERVVGAVLWEDTRPGPAWIQRDRGADALLPAMLTAAEETMKHPETGAVQVIAYDHDAPLIAALRARGYAPGNEVDEVDSINPIGDELPPVVLPEGFALRSTADECDVERRREVFGRAFNHPDPKDWPSAYSYRCLMQAPSYRREQDLFTVAPDGTYASCCILWYDAPNHMGTLEPVGTRPEFRRMGLGRAVVTEAIRRAAALGATQVVVGSDQQFYHAIGFVKRWESRVWTLPRA